MGRTNQTQTVQFQGKFDISDILKGLQQIRAQLGKTTSDKTSFINVDKEMKKVQDLQAKMEAAIQKGFSTPQEMKSFNKMASDLENSLLRVSRGLANIETKGLDEANKALREQESRLKQVATEQEKAIKGLLSGVNGSKAFAARLVQAAKNGKDFVKVQEEINKELATQKDITEKQKKLDDAKENVKNLKEKAKQERARIAAESYTLNRTSYKEESGKNIGSDLAKTVKTKFAQVAATATTPEQAVKAFKKELEILGVTEKDITKIQEQMTTAFRKMNPTIAEYDSKIKSAQSATRTATTDLKNAQNQVAAANTAFSSPEIEQAYNAIAEGARKVKNAESQVAVERAKTPKYTADLKRLEEQTSRNLQTVRQNAQATEQLTMSQQQFANTVERMKSTIQMWISFGSAVQTVRRIFQQTLTDVQNLDKSFAEIAMVTDYSVGQMWESYEQYAQMATELGQTTQSVIQASGLFYQQGLDTAESLTLTEETMKLATLAGLDFKEATSQMTAALRGFKMEMDEGARVTDVYAELAAKAAADVEGISYAMTKTASIAESAGMAFETTSAFLTQMIETTQEAPENIGTAMKTIIARFTELKENVAGTTDSEFEDLDYNKVDTALKSVGVSIKDASGQFRDLDDVFLELSGKWDTLDRNTQRYIATIAAGSRQQSRFIAMMDNYERTMELVEVAYGSAGKASEQFEKYQDTLQFKINKLKTEWEKFRLAIADSDFFKGLVDNLGSLVGYLADLNFVEVSVHIIAVVSALKILSGTLERIKKSTNARGFWGELSRAKGIGGMIAEGGGKQKTPEQEGIEEASHIGAELFEDSIEDASKRSAEYTEEQIEQGFKEGAQAAKQISEENQKVSADDTAELPKNERDSDTDETVAAITEASEKEQTVAKETSAAEQATAELNTGEQIASSKVDAATVATADAVSDTATQTADVAQETAEDVADDVQLTTLLNLINSNITAQGAAICAAIAGARISNTAGDAADAAGDALRGSGKSGGFLQKLKNSFGFKGKGATNTASQAANTTSQVASTGAKVASGLGATLSKILPVVQIAAIAGVLGTAIGSAISKSFTEAEEKKKKEYEEALAKLGENFNMAATTSALNETKTFDEYVKAIEELQGISFRTAEQEAQLESAISYMNDNYPELVKSYDENTGKITLLTDAVEQNSERLAQQAEATRISDLAKMTSGSQSATKAANYWGDKTTGSNAAEWTSEHSGGIGATAGVAGTVLGATAISSALSGAAIGATLGSWVPIVGTAIGAVLGVGVGALIAWGSGAISDTNDTIEETYADFQKIDSDTQGRILEELQAQHAELETVNDIKGWLEDSESNQIALINATEKIYNEIAKEEHQEETKEAIRANLATMTYTNAQGKEVAIDQSIMASVVTDADIANIRDITWKLDENNAAMTLSKNDPWADVKNSWAEVEFSLNGMATNAAEVFIGMRDTLAGMRDSDYKLKDISLVTESEWAALAGYGINQENYQLLQEMDLSDLYDNGPGDADDLYKLVNFYKDNVLEGLILANADVNESEQAELQEYTGHRMYEDWEKRRKEALSGILTPEAAAEQIAQIQAEMVEQGMSQDLIYAIFGNVDGENIEGSFAAIEQEWKEMQTGLIEEIGMDENFINSLTGEALGSLYTLMTKTLSEADEDIKNNLITLYENAFSKIQDSDLSDSAKSQLMNFISNNFTPENFDPALVGHYASQLQIFGYSAEDAADMVTEFSKSFEDNDLKKMNSDLGNTEESIEKFEESIQGVINAMDFLVENIGNFTTDNFTSKMAKAIAMSDELASSMNFLDFNVADGYGSIAGMMTNSYILAGGEGVNDYIAAVDQYGEDSVEANKEMWEAVSFFIAAKEVINSFEDAYNDAVDVFEDATKAEKDGKKAVEDTTKALEDAQKALYEAEHGTDYYNPSVGAGYNYDSQLERIETQLERITNGLEDSVSYQEKIALLNEEIFQEQEASILRQAKMQTLEGALADSDKWLQENASQYVKQMSDGSYIISAELYDNPDQADAWSEEIIRRVEEANDWRTQMEDLADQEDEAERERLEKRKQRQEDYVSFLEEGAEILREQAEEEVSILEEKYNAMEEADNNYLDALEEAINKQRELRDRENQYENLATKEKKLVLMQRDTSGANQKEVMSLEKEIEDDRQNLLDDEVDRLIDNMRGLAEEQAELRNIEVELKNAIIEETNYIKQFAAISSSWTSQEDANAFYLENVDTSNMTAEQIELAMQDFADAYEAGSLYMIGNKEQIDEFISATAQQVQDKITEMGDFWTLTSDNTTAQVKLDIEETKNDAKEAAEEAEQAAIDAQAEYKKLKIEAEEAEKAATTALTNFRTAQASALTTAQTNYENFTKAQQQTTIKALQMIMSDDAIMEYLGIDKKEFESVLNGTWLEDYGTFTIETLAGDTVTYDSEKALYEGLKAMETMDILYRITNNTTGDYYQGNTGMGLYFKELEEKYGDTNFIGPMPPKEDILKSTTTEVETQPTISDFSDYNGDGMINNEDWQGGGQTVTTTTTVVTNIQPNEEIQDIKYNHRNAKNYLGGFYSDGGYVDYTGLAMVHGTPNKPEAFLSADDTARIGEAAKLLADLPIFNATSNAENAVSTNIGDTSIEIHINVESISDDYDVDQMIERVKQDIVDVAKPIGTSVILNK